MKVGNVEVPIAATAGMLTIIAMFFGGWFFADGYFAHAEDLLPIQKKNQVMEWSFEQSQNDMRIDITEDRIWREEQKPNPDRNRIKKWEGQIQKYEMRQDHLQQMQDQIKLKTITN